jgi:histidinol-phosphatase (PHP family)
MHTPLCKHAEGQPEDYAESALQRGLKGIIFTCHSPMPDKWWPNVRMDLEQLDEYIAMVDRAAKAYAGQLDVRLGMETDFFPGMEWWAERLNERCDFHHVLGSVHYFGPDYRARYW